MRKLWTIRAKRVMATNTACTGIVGLWWLAWDNVALSAGQIAALTANQRAYWGF